MTIEQAEALEIGDLFVYNDRQFPYRGCYRVTEKKINGVVIEHCYLRDDGAKIIPNGHKCLMRFKGYVVKEKTEHDYIVTERYAAEFNDNYMAKQWAEYKRIGSNRVGLTQ